MTPNTNENIIGDTKSEPTREEMIKHIQHVVGNKELKLGCVIECEDVWDKKMCTETLIYTEQEDFGVEGECSRLYFQSGNELLISGVINVFDGSVILRNEREWEVKVIGHPVMIGDVLDRWGKSTDNTPDCVDTTLIRYGKRKKMREPINNQSDECIKFVYDLLPTL